MAEEKAMRQPVSHPDPMRQLGFWSAVLAAGCSLTFCAAVVPVQLRALAPPWDVAAPLVPSLLLAPAFLVLLVCVHSAAPAEQKIWSRLAVAFAGVYVPLVWTAYVLELLVVEPLVMRGEADRV